MLAYSKPLSVSMVTFIKLIKDVISGVICVKWKILVKKSEFDEWMKGHRPQRVDINALVDEIVREFREPSVSIRARKKKPKA